MVTKLASGYRLKGKGFRLQASGERLQASDLRLQVAHFSTPGCTWRLPVVKNQITSTKLQTNSKRQIPSHKPSWAALDLTLLLAFGICYFAVWSLFGPWCL
jgi:hypothetical protein